MRYSDSEKIKFFQLIVPFILSCISGASEVPNSLDLQ